MMISTALGVGANCASHTAITPYRLLVTSLMNFVEGLFKSLVLQWNNQPHNDITISKFGVNIYIKQNINGNYDRQIGADRMRRGNAIKCK
jgi:hypothetical protein